MRFDVVAYREGQPDTSLGVWNDANLAKASTPEAARRCIHALRQTTRKEFNTARTGAPKNSRAALLTLWLAGVREVDQILCTAKSGPVREQFPAWQRPRWARTKTGTKPAYKRHVQRQRVKDGGKRDLWDWRVTRSGKPDITGTVDVSDVKPADKTKVAYERTRAAAKAAGAGSPSGG